MLTTLINLAKRLVFDTKIQNTTFKPLQFGSLFVRILRIGDVLASTLVMKLNSACQEW